MGKRVMKSKPELRDGDSNRISTRNIEFSGAGRRKPKRVGEVFEAAFLTKAASLGFGVAKPWGDSERYDFILDNGKQFLRIQVKATQKRNYRSYVVNSHHSVSRQSRPYTKK